MWTRRISPRAIVFDFLTFFLLSFFCEILKNFVFLNYEIGIGADTIVAGLAAAAGAAAAAFSLLRRANSQGGYGGRKRRALEQQVLVYICLFTFLFLHVLLVYLFRVVQKKYFKKWNYWILKKIVPNYIYANWQQ